MCNRFAIFNEINAERASLDEKWGGSSHDDTRNDHDWAAYIVKHLGRAIRWPFDVAVFRYQMVRVAALAVAAIEWCDRKQGGGQQR